MAGKLKVVFLDRDGVINQFPGHGDYVTTVRNFKFIPQSRKAISRLTEAGYNIIVISNQAGVGRGVFTQQTLDLITKKMMAGITQSGGRLKAVLYCTHKPDDKCDCRKPNIGNVKKAVKLLNVSLSALKGSYFIGDSDKDMEVAKKAGLKSILVTSGHDGYRTIKTWPVQPDVILPNLYKATEFILSL